MDIAATFVMALGGVLLAWVWFTYGSFRWAEAGALALLGILAGVCVGWGRSRLRSNPRLGAACLEAQAVVLVIFGLGLSGAAVIVGIAVALATPQGTPELHKQLVTALGAALGTFVTTSLVKPLQSPSGVIARFVKKTFKQAFAQCGYPGTSKEYRAAFIDELEGTPGWEYKARRARARILAAAGCPGQQPVAKPVPVPASAPGPAKPTEKSTHS